jgi:hypothetical protein
MYRLTLRLDLKDPLERLRNLEADFAPELHKLA